MTLPYATSVHEMALLWVVKHLVYDACHQGHLASHTARWGSSAFCPFESTSRNMARVPTVVKSSHSSLHSLSSNLIKTGSTYALTFLTDMKNGIKWFPLSYCRQTQVNMCLSMLLERLPLSGCRVTYNCTLSQNYVKASTVTVCLQL